MSSIHFFRWTEQLRSSGHQVFWIDVYDSGNVNKSLDFVKQTVGWRNRINYPGRYFIKDKLPAFNQFLNFFNQRKLADIVDQKIKEVDPDVVHSFVMYSGAAPLLDILKKHPNIKWVFSAWGNDLYFYKSFKANKLKMQSVFPMLDYMFADCARDYAIAKSLGFKGKYLGTFPTGGGYNLLSYEPYISSVKDKRTIVIKGYEHQFGRCIKVLKAMSLIKDKLHEYDIKVFAANTKVFNYVNNSELSVLGNLTIYGQLCHTEILKIMGESYIYIGNSISDGMPNTLLEAIIMGAFPIQSNPGGATAEIIENGRNGLLIQDPESPEDIAQTILRALNNRELIREGINYNNRNIKPGLEREKIRNQVLEKYGIIERDISNG